MRLFSASLASLLVLGGFCFPARGEETARRVATEPPAPPLVQAARAELSGRNAERARLLADALQADPESPLVHWLAGYVREDGRWRKPGEIAMAASTDKVLRRYKELRDQTKDDLAGNLKLADWCREHQLPDEARAHFTRVLELDPTNARALAGLDYRRFRGGWATDAQIADFQERERRIKQSELKWKPTLEKIRQRLESKSEAARKEGADELMAIHDREAVVPMLRRLGGRTREIDVLLVDSLGEFNGIDGTRGLVQLAIRSPFEAARTSASLKLKQRELKVVAPLLLGLMYKPQMAHEVRDAGYGVAIWRRQLSIERQFNVECFVSDAMNLVLPPVVTTANVETTRFAPQTGSWTPYEVTSVQVSISQADPTPGLRRINSLRRGISNRGYTRLPYASPQTVAEALPDAVALSKSVAAQAADWNERVASALSIVTGKKLAAEPSVWWSWWDDQYYLTAPKRKPTQVVSYRTTRSIVPSQTTSSGNFGFQEFRYSCFAAGTLVATRTGLCPIERVRVGDRVLSQDVATGELAYKPVLRTTIRPAMPLVMLTVDKEQIACTPGHPFWVGGTGWMMAHELTAGFQLHGLAGGVPLWEVNESPAQQTYNLVVADFSSYFVGRQGLLVHDNSIPEPAEGALPGLTH